MRNFTHRSTQAELMDGEIPYPEFRDCLKQLERINGLTLAYPPTLRWVRQIIHGRRGALSLLDVGSGGGDMLRRLRKIDPALALTGVDLSPHSTQAAREFTPDKLRITYLTSDLFALPADQRFGLITSSLFTHHLTDAQLVEFLRWMEARATRGWFVNDLHRHWLAYYFIKAATALFSRNRLIRHDAAVSVARAFTRADWQRLIAAAGIPAVKVRWCFPFRWTVARVK